MSWNCLTRSRALGAVLVSLGVAASGAAIAMSRSKVDLRRDTAGNAPEPEVPGGGFRIVAYNLGVLDPNSVTERTWTITNDADNPATVKRVGRHCGCIASEL